MVAQKHLFLPYGIVSVVFGYVGAELLLRVSDAQFSLVVPWLMLGIANIHAANGLKLYMSSLIALVAVIRFAFAGSIDWYHGTIALLGVTTGAYVAARLSTRIPTGIIRTLVIVYGVGLTVYFFWQTYAA